MSPRRRQAAPAGVLAALLISLLSFVPTPAAVAALDEDCQSMEPADFGEPLPARATVPPGDSVCFVVVPITTGSHLVRSSQPVSGGAELRTTVNTELGTLNSSTSRDDVQRFTLDAGATYNVEVTNTAAVPLEAGVGVFDAATAQGCDPVTADTTWASEESTGVDFSEPDVLLCHELAIPATGAPIEPRQNWLVRSAPAGVQALVLDESLRDPCDDLGTIGVISSPADDGRYVCPLYTGSDYRVISFNQTKDASTTEPAASGGFSVNALRNMSGCATDLDGTVSPASRMESFDLANHPTTISGADGFRCHQSSLPQGSKVYVDLDDSNHRWFLIDAHGINQRGRFEQVQGRSQRTFCVAFSPCTLTGEAPYRVVVEGPSDESYKLGLRRSAGPLGCTTLPSISGGVPEQTGVLADGDVRCFHFSAAEGDVVAPISRRPDDADARNTVTILAGNGDSLGSTPNVSGFDLTYPLRDDDYTLVLEPGESGPGPYALTVDCVNEPCGPFELDGVVNNELGAGEVTLRLQGAGLIEETAVLLRQGSEEIDGVVRSSLADATLLDVAVDLRGHSGSWDVVVTSGRGVEHVLVDGVSVKETTWPGALRATVQGPADLRNLESASSVFVPGRRHKYVVNVTNVGDLDAVAGPVFMHGLPPGATIEPDFDMVVLDAEGAVEPYDYEPESFFLADDEGTATGFMVNRLGPGVSASLDFWVTTPLDTPEWDFVVRAGDCALTDDGTVARRGSAAGNCVRAIRDVLAGLLPGADCVSLLGLIPQAWQQDFNVLSGASTFSPMTIFDRTVAINLDGAGCVSDIGVKGLKTFGEALDYLAKGKNAIKGAQDALAGCFPDETEDDASRDEESDDGPVFGVPPGGYRPPRGGGSLPNFPVNSIDPNAVVGPPGAGPDRAFRGSGVHRYDVYFENDEEATAPAQEVFITSRLDPTVYDLESLRFTGVEFGDTTYATIPRRVLDHRIDLGPEEMLGVQVDASVSAGGELAVALTTVDPLTQGLPNSPFVGFLPPNVDGDEGQGVVHYEVELLDPPSGTEVENVADIVFDLNDPITTNTWSNLVDTEAPTASVAAPAAATGPFAVTWAGSDPTSGVARMDVYVAVDGGRYELWQDDVAPGTAVYPAEAGRSYAFGAIAFDWSHNRSVSTAPFGPTTVVDAGEPAEAGKLVMKKKPKIKGKLKVGKILRATPGKWSPRPTKVRYQWYVGNKKVKGAKNARLKVRRAFRGRKVKVRVVVKAPGYPKVKVVRKTGRRVR